LNKRDTRSDTRGILDPRELMARVRFRRIACAPSLAEYVEHYWLIDWDLDEPYEQHVVPHPSVNIVFQSNGGNDFGEVAGVGLELFSIKLETRGRVSGVQFRPGGFRPFFKDSVQKLTSHRVPVREVFELAPESIPGLADSERVSALDSFLTGLRPAADEQAQLAMRLCEQIRHDRSVLRVASFARQHGLSVRGLQRLFAEYVGVGPKWVILRYRIHEAIELASPEADWAHLAADLGYSDQAHLVRDFTATIGVPPGVYSGQHGGRDR
jgi:AraC-like DNA-binding protein